DVQFGDALVSSVVLVFRKAPPPSEHAVEFTFGGTMAHPHAREAVSLRRLRSSRKWTAYPEHAGNDRRALPRGPKGTNGANGPYGEGATLGDLFRIQRGIATGCNKFFVLERADA